MVPKKTVYYFRNLIILVLFLCINRSYLIKNQLMKTICNFIYFCVCTTVTSFFIYDTFSDSNINPTLLAFQMLISIELLGLTVAARIFTKQYIALEKLDEKFGLDDNYVKAIRGKTNVATMVLVVSMIVDIGGMAFLSARPSILMMFFLGATAHDAELAFISLFIDVVNIRLGKSITANPSFGSSVYRHLLIATSYFNYGFQFEIQLMFLVTLLSTIFYGFIIVMLNSNGDNFIVFYIGWREFKLLYSLWMVCLAAYRTGGICNRLQFHLTSKVALCTKIDKASKSQQMLCRWYTSVLCQQLQFTSSQSIAISLNVPVVMLDVSINYLLLVIQITFYIHHLKGGPISKETYVTFGEKDMIRQLTIH